MNFNDYILLNEMLVHQLAQKPDRVVAFRGHIWLTNDFIPTTEIERTIRAEHPQGVKLMGGPVRDWNDLIDWLDSYVPDVFTGYWNPEKKILSASSDFATNPVSSPLVKKVAETLKARHVSVGVIQNVDTKEYERAYTRKEMLGKLPDIMYHGTTTKYLAAIMRVGLRPGISQSNWDKQGIYHDDRTFLAARPESAEFHASNASHLRGGFPCIIQVAIPDRALIEPDYDADAVATGTKAYGHKPKEAENVYGSVNSMKMSRNTGLIAYTGRIPAAFIKGVFLYMGGSWKKVRLDTLKRRIEEDPWDWGYHYGLY